MTGPEGAGDPLAGVRVLECTDASGAYCGRLLADLGADVVMVEPLGGGASRTHEPVVWVEGEGVSCFDRFVNLNKRSVALELGTPAGREAFLRLVAAADVLVETPGLHDLGEEALRAANPALVRVCVSAFGRTGPYASHRSDDLTTLAAGGLLSLGGYADTEPVAVCGEQTYFARSIFGAAGALLALLQRDRTGEGDTVDVCAQEAIANALEDAIPDCDLNGRVRRRRGERPREAGTGTYRCADGFVAMVAGRLGTQKAFAALTAWMAEEGAPGAAELTSARWADHRFRQSDAAIDHFTEVFERFASARTKAELYAGAQARKIAFAPVNSPGEVLGDPQLAACGFFEEVADPSGATLVYPGRPYSIDGLGPLRRRGVPYAGEHTREVLRDEAGLGDDALAALLGAGCP